MPRSFVDRMRFPLLLATLAPIALLQALSLASCMLGFLAWLISTDPVEDCRLLTGVAGIHTSFGSSLLLAILAVLAGVFLGELLVDRLRVRILASVRCRDADLRSGLSRFSRVAEDLPGRIEKDEEILGWSWSEGVPECWLFGSLLINLLLSAVTFATMHDIPRACGAGGEILCWFFFFVFGAVILMQRHWWPKLACPLFLTLLCIGTGEMMPGNMPPWGPWLVGSLALILALVQIRRYGDGRVMVHTSRRMLEYRLLLHGGQAELRASGDLPVDDGVQRHYFLPYPAGQSGDLTPALRRPGPAPVLSVWVISVVLTISLVLVAFERGRRALMYIGGVEIQAVAASMSGWMEPLEQSSQVALAMDPGEPYALTFLAEVRCTQGRHTEALALLARVTDDGESGERARVIRDKVLRHIALEREAEERCGSPALIAARRARSLAMDRRRRARGLELGSYADIAEEIMQAREASRLAPEDVEVLVMLAEALTCSYWSLQISMKEIPGDLSREAPWSSLEMEVRSVLNRLARMKKDSRLEEKFLLCEFQLVSLPGQKSRLEALVAAHGVDWSREPIGHRQLTVASALRDAGKIAEALAFLEGKSVAPVLGEQRRDLAGRLEELRATLRASPRED